MANVKSSGFKWSSFLIHTQKRYPPWNMLLKNYWRRRYILELIKFRFNYCPVKKKINSGFFHNNFSKEDELMWKYPKNIFFFIILYFNIADFDWLMFMELQFTQSSSSVNLLCTQRQICMLKIQEISVTV